MDEAVGRLKACNKTSATIKAMDLTAEAIVWDGPVFPVSEEGLPRASSWCPAGTYHPEGGFLARGD